MLCFAATGVATLYHSLLGLSAPYNNTSLPKLHVGITGGIAPLCRPASDPVVHLGSVMALLAALPYGKFTHAVYRSAALLKWTIERRQPSRLQLSDD